MDAEIKAKWLEALRSGRYKQTDDFLREGNRYCCLGVLCDIIDPSKWHPHSDYGETFYSYAGDDEQLPPDSICEAAGLPKPLRGGVGVATGENIVNRLASLNDAGKTFEDIACVIEDEL